MALVGRTIIRPILASFVIHDITHPTHKAIAMFCHRLNVPALAAVVAQRLSERRNRKRDVAFLDHSIGPYRSHQF